MTLKAECCGGLDRTIGSILALLLLSGPINPVVAQGSVDFAYPALAGVDSVDARVILTWDDDLDLDQETTRGRLQTVFELTLREFGVTISRDAPNYLDVSFVLLDQGDGGVSYSYGIELNEPTVPARGVRFEIDMARLAWLLDFADSSESVSPRDTATVSAFRDSSSWREFVSRWGSSKRTWGQTWEGPSGVGTVGSVRLRDTLERNVKELAEDFVNQYKAAGH